MGQGQRTSAAPLAPSCWRKWRACASSLRRGMQQSRGRETVPCGVLRAHGSASTVRGMTATEWCQVRVLSSRVLADTRALSAAHLGRGASGQPPPPAPGRRLAATGRAGRRRTAGQRRNSSRTARRLHTASTAREPCCRRAEAPAAPLRRRSARGEAASPCCSLRGRRSSTLRQATSPLRRRRSPPARATGLQETEGVRVRRKPSTRA